MSPGTRTKVPFLQYRAVIVFWTKNNLSGSRIVKLAIVSSWQNSQHKQGVSQEWRIPLVTLKWTKLTTFSL